MLSNESSKLICSCNVCKTGDMACPHPNYCMMFVNFDTEETISKCSDNEKMNLFSCNRSHRNDQGNRAFTLCCNSSMCNVKGNLPKHISSDFDKSQIYVFIVSAAALGILVLLYLCVLLLRIVKVLPAFSSIKPSWKSAVIPGKPQKALPMASEDLQVQLNYDEAGLESSHDQGPVMMYRYSIARDLKLLNVIGQGKFGTVFKAEYLGDFYAVKIMTTFHSEEWDHEIAILRTVSGHRNMCSYHASDIAPYQDNMHLWIMLDYKENHALHDFLVENKVDMLHALMMIKDITSGIAYLHRPLSMIRIKPSIVHRDIKSKNILVDRHLRCSISDFGFAMTDIRESTFQAICRNMKSKKIYMEEIDEKKKIQATSLEHLLRHQRNMQVGTVRYMAPELLTMSFNLSEFWNYQMIDMYSMGLVIWEIASRSYFPVSCLARLENVREYTPPYHGKVENDPRIEQMIPIVVSRKHRPEACPQWFGNEIYQMMYELMEDLWHAVPCQRINASTAEECAESMLNHHKNVIKNLPK